MRNLFRVSGLFLVLWTGPDALSWSEPPDAARRLPEPVEEEAALVVLPARYGGGSKPVELLDPAGLEAHLTRHDDPEVELTYSCGSPFQPPPGRYLVHIQGDWRMTPYSLLLHYSESSGGRIKSYVPVGEAGRVTLPDDETGRHLELHLLHAGSYRENGFLRWEVAPRRAADELGEGVLMPVGRAIGALWDRQEQKYVALSRPFEVRGRATVEVPLERPGGAAHLMVQVKRHAADVTAGDWGVDLALKQGRGERPPDLEVLTADKVSAVWYGLPPGRAELRAASKHAAFGRELELSPGEVEHLEGQMTPWPALDVALDLPAPLRHGKLALEVRRFPSGEVLAQHPLKQQVDSHRFEKLPPELLEVDLQTSLGSFSRQVDLSSSQDGFLLLKPELVTLRGTIYHGDEPHPAKVTFTTVARTALEAQTNEEGTYEVVLLHPLRGVSVELAGVEAAPYVDLFSPAVAESRELDVRVPDGVFNVRVLNAVTREGVPGASVTIRNAYSPEDENTERDQQGRRNKKERVISQSVSTDTTGGARLPPLRQGSLEIRASAEGYSQMSQPVQAQVLDENTDQTFEVLLEPMGETVTLRLRLPDGAPAAGAEALLVDSLATGRDLFSARANGEGEVEPPRRQAGFLLVRHPAAAFIIREWQLQEGEGPVDWVLPVAAGQPLTIRVKDASGKSAAGRAELALWVEGRRLSGRVLSWLAGTSPVADSNGYWIGKNLPRGPVEVLAWTVRVRDDAQAGNLEPQAIGVQFPWPDPVEVQAFE